MAQVLKRCKHDRKQWGKCPDSWTVRYWDRAGKPRERSFKVAGYPTADFQTARAAAGKFATTIEVDKHKAPAPESITFRSYVEDFWLPTLAQRGASIGTVRIRTAALRNHLLPRFGDDKLAGLAVNREGVQLFLAGLPAQTAKVVRTTLSAVLSEARDSRRVTDYALAKLKLPKASQRAEFVFPSYAQLSALADAMPEGLRPAIWIMRGTGLRPGEVLAVKRESFSDGHLRIDEQVQENPHRICALKAREAGESRDIPVPSYVTAIIEAQPIQSGYLFPGVTTSVFGHAFRKAAKAAGWPGHPHWLRHSFASVALSNGVPITDVSRWLGHRDINVTYAIYGHMVPSAWDNARDVLDAEYKEWSS